VSRIWNDYWFRPAPLFDLAVLRIVSCALCLWILLVTDTLPSLLGSARLPDYWYLPLPILRILTLQPFEAALPTATTLLVIYWVTAVSGLLALVGLLTNPALVVFTLGSVFLQAFLYSFADFHHRQGAMMIALAALALAPSGGALSLDSLLAHRRAGKKPFDLERELSALSRFAGWPILLVQWIFVLMYISAVLSKLVFRGPDWMNGFTLQAYLVMDALRWGSDLGLWIAQYHWLVFLMQWVTVIFQATFVLPVLFPRLLWIYAPLGLFFHIGIYVLMRAPFWHWIALYVVFVPWAAALRRLLAMRQARRVAIEGGVRPVV
jgi:hypothetical protein